MKIKDLTPQAARWIAFGRYAAFHLAEAEPFIWPIRFSARRRHGWQSFLRFAAGVVLYDGESAVGFGDSLFAVPIRALWETT